MKKGGNPYTRTKASVMANLRAAVKDLQPKAAYHQVEEMAGGIMNVDSLSLVHYSCTKQRRMTPIITKMLWTLPGQL